MILGKIEDAEIMFTMHPGDPVTPSEAVVTAQTNISEELTISNLRQKYPDMTLAKITGTNEYEELKGMSNDNRAELKT